MLLMALDRSEQSKCNRITVHTAYLYHSFYSTRSDLSNNNLNCQQVCVLLSLRQPSFEYKGECEDASGQTISFSSLEADAPHYCEGINSWYGNQRDA